MRIKSTISALAVIALLSGSSLLRADEPTKDKKPQDKDAKPISIPFETLKSQHLAVEVKINGKGPYKLIFDTGAPLNLLNVKVAKEAGIVGKNYNWFFAMLDPTQKQTIKTLEFGDLKVENQATAVFDHPTVTAISNAHGPVEGIIGFPFFAKYRMTIDYQAKKLTFVPVDYEPVDMVAAMQKRLQSGKPAPRKIAAPAGILGIKVEKKDDDAEAGVTISEVFGDSAAAKAGFKTGDRLLTLDGRWTDTAADCSVAASNLRAGREAIAVVLRDGKKVELKVTLRPGI